MFATTTKLFLEDSQLVDFRARVARQWTASGKHLIALSETAFYPTSGGQPHDTGSIAGVGVVDVYEADGEIVHELDGTVEAPGEVACKVDWQRRHDHMQQHTGQHILSQALVRVCDIPTAGFAIGPDWSTIVLDRKPDDESLQSALELANAVIDEARPIDVLFPTQAELEALPIRGAIPEKEGIRVIRVEGFDWSPCCGTHCKSAGAVRLIEVLGIRREKNSYRLEFVCGRRAERISLRNAKIVGEVAAILDTAATEVVDRTRSLLHKSRAQEEELDRLKEDRLITDRESLLALADRSGDEIVAVVLPDRSTGEIRRLAHLLVERPDIVVLLVGKEADKIGLAFARSADRTEDMNDVMRRVCRDTGCRGGGNPAFATGGGGGEIDAHLVLETALQAVRGR